MQGQKQQPPSLSPFLFLTHNLRGDASCQTDSIKVIIKHLIILDGAAPSVRHFDPGRFPAKNPVFLQDRTTSRADQDAGKGVVENIILLQQATSGIEDANPALFAAVDLVPSQHGVGLSLDPHAGQGVAVNIVLHQKALPRVIDEHAAVLPAKYLVLLYDRVATGSGGRKRRST